MWRRNAGAPQPNSTASSSSAELRCPPNWTKPGETPLAGSGSLRPTPSNFVPLRGHAPMRPSLLRHHRSSYLRCRRLRL
ncbi:MAG: hypothetical protein RI900_1137 [Actinomycetota bacterium]